MNKKQKIKEQILNSLSGKFKVIKVKREYLNDEVGISCDFISDGRRGNFRYTFTDGIFGNVIDDDGTDFFNVDKDINKKIYDWVEDNIEWDSIIKWKGKEIK